MWYLPLVMKLYKGIAQLATPLEKVVATIGNFDGVHVGHQEIFRLVMAHAKRIGGTSVAVTFRPHPIMALSPVTAPHLLNSYEEKLELLEQLGVQVVVEEPFSREFSNTTPDQFVTQYLVGKLGVTALYLGYDFAFGKERAGSVETLRRLAEAKGMESEVVPPFKVNGVVVSSSLIRKTLEEGDMALARSYLGRAFFVRGPVLRGDGRGKKIGVPTANLSLTMRKLPRVGVYASRSFWKGRAYNSITNVGYNPTFKGDGTDLPLKIETHFFDFDNDLYGDEITVEFHAFLRDEVKFSGVDALLAQIGKDKTEARKILAGLGFSS